MVTIHVKVTNDVPDEHMNNRPVKLRINNRIEEIEIEINETANEDEPQDEPQDDQFDDIANDSNDNSSDASSDVSTEDLSDEGKKKRVFEIIANHSNDNSSDASSDVSTEDLSDEGKRKRLFEMIDDINETEMKIHNICSSQCPDIAEILMTRMIRSLKRYRKLYEDIYGPIKKKDGAILIA